MGKQFKRFLSLTLSVCLLLLPILTAEAQENGTAAEEAEVSSVQTVAEETEAAKAESAEENQPAPPQKEESVSDSPAAETEPKAPAQEPEEVKPAQEPEEEKPAQEPEENKEEAGTTEENEDGQDAGSEADGAEENEENQDGEAEAADGNEADKPETAEDQEGEAEENQADAPETGAEDAENGQEEDGEPSEPAESDPEEPENDELEEGEDEDYLLTAVDGDAILVSNQATTVKINSPAGAQSYASYTMTEAGLMTITFKSVGTAHGNVAISIFNEDNVQLWYRVWATTEGTINYSMFVEAGEYSITLAKSDPGDMSEYYVAMTPIPSRTGELGTKNNTTSSAAELTLGVKATGIFTYQDLDKGNKDYYTFYLSDPGWVDIQVTNKTVSGIDVNLYGNDAITENITSMHMYGPPAGNINETSTVTVNVTGMLDAGVYYLEFVDGGSVGRYDLTVTARTITITEKEKNDSFMRAYNNGNMLSLDGNPVIGVLSESDGMDCYCFHLPKPTKLDLSLKVEFEDVFAAVFRRDETTPITGSIFGMDGTPGFDGNPYELELRGLKLDEGDYYVFVGYGTQHDTGRYTISAKSKITASTLDVTIDGDYAKIKASSAPSGMVPVKSFIHIFEKATGYEVDVFEYTNQTSIDLPYNVPTSGEYVIQYTVTDGTNWDEKWATFKYEGKVFAIESISATSDENGVITCKATYSGNGKLKNSVARLKLGSTTVEEKPLDGATSWTFNAPTSGTYDIEFWGTITGGTWKSGTVKHTVKKKVILPLKISALNVSSDKKGNISCVAETQDGYALQQMTFNLFQSGTQLQSKTGKALTAAFKVNIGGTYTVQCVAYDGMTWAEKWTAVTVVVSSSAVLTVSAVSATVDEDGKISMSASTSGGDALVSSTFNVFEGSTKVAEIAATSGKATFQANKNATYKIQYVAYDGKTWAEKWTTATVSVADLAAPTIDSLSANTDTTGKLDITITYTSKKPPVSITYNVYDPSGTLVSYEVTKDATHSVQYVTKSGEHKIQVVLYNGAVWVEKWMKKDVTVGTSSETDLSVTSLTVTHTGMTSIHGKAVTNDNRELAVSQMKIFRAGELIATKDCVNKEADFTGLVKGATYAVQYVAYDGKKWAEKWASVTTGTSNLTIDSWSATQSGHIIDCIATVTNEVPIQQARMIVFDTAGKAVAEWNWSGSGDYLIHSFNMDSSVTVKAVQYVIYDGIKWVEAWDAV